MKKNILNKIGRATAPDSVQSHRCGWPPSLYTLYILPLFRQVYPRHIRETETHQNLHRTRENEFWVKWILMLGEANSGGKQPNDKKQKILGEGEFAAAAIPLRFSDVTPKKSSLP